MVEEGEYMEYFAWSTLKRKVISASTIKKRENALTLAGFTREEIYHKEKYAPGDYREVGLITLPIKTLKQLNILKGRKNEIKNFMRDQKLTRAEAIARAVTLFKSKGFETGSRNDYIDYYYSRG